jgi:nucleoside phosphorylase
VDVGVVTVLKEELSAARAVFGVRGPARRVQGQPFYRTEIPGDPQAKSKLSIAISRAAKPLNVHAGRPVMRLIDLYAPRIIVLLGIAAGLPDRLRRGDVVVPRKVFYYEPQRLTESGSQHRPEHAEPTIRIYMALIHTSIVLHST